MQFGAREEGNRGQRDSDPSPSRDQLRNGRSSPGGIQVQAYGQCCKPLHVVLGAGCRKTLMLRGLAPAAPPIALNILMFFLFTTDASAAAAALIPTGDTQNNPLGPSASSLSQRPRPVLFRA